METLKRMAPRTNFSVLYKTCCSLIACSVSCMSAVTTVLNLQLLWRQVLCVWVLYLIKSLPSWHAHIYVVHRFLELLLINKQAESYNSWSILYCSLLTSDLLNLWKELAGSSMVNNLWALKRFHSMVSRTRVYWPQV